MPEFFSFTPGAENNPRLRGAETTPLLVGRFRAVVPASEAAATPPPLLPAGPGLPTQRPPYLASRSYWNAPVSRLPSRSPSPFSAAGGGRLGRRNTTGYESSSDGGLSGYSSYTGYGRLGGRSRGKGRGQRTPGVATGHGFYNNTGYGAIAAAGYYDGIGDDDEEDEEDDEVEQYDDGYDEDDEDEDDDNDISGHDYDDLENEYEDEPAYVDDDLGGPVSGPRDLVGVAGNQDEGGKSVPGRGVIDHTVRRARWPRWAWLPWGNQRRGSVAAPGGTSEGNNDSRRRRSSALGPSAAQRYRLNQRIRRQQYRQRQRQLQHRRIRRKLRRTYRISRYCGRRVVRWVRRSVYRAGRHLRNLWLTPKNATVRRAVDRWWSRWTLLVVVPAVLAIAWCALPFPQYPLSDNLDADDGKRGEHRTPGHGEARVRIHFWFFLLAYYGPYNITALVWITKVFNLYSLNWWPSSLGFPLSVSLLAAFSLAMPAVLFTSVPAAEFLASHNTAWVTWTFAVMAMPVAAALVLLLLHERHRMIRHALSDTQRIFTSARWAGEADTLPRRWREEQQQKLNYQRHMTAAAEATSSTPKGRFRVGLFGRRSRAESAPPSPAMHHEHAEVALGQHDLETSALLGGSRGGSASAKTSPVKPSRLAKNTPGGDILGPSSSTLPTLPPFASQLEPPFGPGSSSAVVGGAVASSRRGGHWLPTSFVRFLWLMSALFMSLLVYELGEASASLFLAALPTLQHATVYTVAYVYGWIVTVFLLDAVTGWILGGRQGERVGSYPLGWVFKLYFMLTYQTYVRALYVRLRSPSQFVLLQVLSSTTLIVISPLLMSSWTHRLLVALGLNAQTYNAFQKVCVRNIFVRFVAENASMLAFLGSLFVLHFGPNRDVYPYFAFDDGLDGGPGYTFSFTLYASSITWACELVAAFIVSGLIRYFYDLSVVGEGKMDLAVWPELLPTSVAVSVHVLQNMLFSIVRIQFW
ncbi:uncharacterized protein SPSK_00690 [Sporothrix schenckii 1099-18]|uniref:Uncharacterized protein n=2 Tax=Sporothrix schenckii TaxID=29908 RepID=U7PQ10_SPOS1|nr:uncharacterized protein SPSK_00690 [Sporothrix schenckii 1099-18]ERS96829.1 hypothetical protein HMPREF1624_07038 [Sporothrix schenckii ATCC 58251]KJR81563.1 hypothetical protein SPSK_00690 [Sporothrix schenckii 1099-18]